MQLRSRCSRPGHLATIYDSCICTLLAFLADWCASILRYRMRPLGKLTDIAVAGNLRTDMAGMGLRLATAIAAITLSAACASLPEPLPSEEVATAATNYGRAFGRVIYVDNGEERADWGPAAPLTLYVRSNASGQIQSLNVERQGAFFWPLQAGEYLVVGYEAAMGGGRNRRLSGRLWATFSVPRPGEAVYIGDLRIEQRGPQFRVAILDHYSEAVKKEEERIRAARLQVSKGLMQKEVEQANYRWIVDVCSAVLWGLECDGYTRGVEPLEPHGTGTGTGFAVTQDLLPVLRWKPSSRQGITYDIEIYESVSFPQTEFGNPRWLRGARIVHEEGLSEPRYTPANPLKPGMRYEWTVRLRSGDTVSTWSTGGSMGWFAIDIRSGSYFVFFTPER